MKDGLHPVDKREDLHQALNRLQTPMVTKVFAVGKGCEFVDDYERGAGVESMAVLGVYRLGKRFSYSTDGSILVFRRLKQIKLSLVRPKMRKVIARESQYLT